MKYLIVGLESSCTRIVSKLIAYNLDLIKNIEDWDGYDSIFDNDFLVCHKSLPHGNNFIDMDFINKFDRIIITSRDWNCSLLSKIEKHEHNVINANQEHEEGIKILKNIISNRDNVVIFSSETAFLLQESYMLPFLKQVGIEHPKSIFFDNPNRKYLKELGL